MKPLHVLAAICFLVAIGLYVASSTTGVWIFGGIGVALEVVAWIILLKREGRQAIGDKST